jgi:hypothetical protein
MARRVHSTTNDGVPCFVGGASRLQELGTERLVFSRIADEPYEGEMLTDEGLEEQPANAISAR